MRPATHVIPISTTSSRALPLKEVASHLQCGKSSEEIAQRSSSYSTYALYERGSIRKGFSNYSG